MGGLSPDPAKRERQLAALGRGRKKLAEIELGHIPRPHKEPEPDPHTAPPVATSTHQEDGIEVVTYDKPKPTPAPTAEEHPADDPPAPPRPVGFLGGLARGTRR